MSGWALDFDDIQPMLNPVQRSTLVEILTLTPAHKRVKLAMAFAGINGATWINLAGLNPAGHGTSTASLTLLRWFEEYRKLPLGAAVRLSAVLGVPTELIFAEQIRREVDRREEIATKPKKGKES